MRHELEGIFQAEVEKRLLGTKYHNKTIEEVQVSIYDHWEDHGDFDYGTTCTALNVKVLISSKKGKSKQWLEYSI